MTNFQRVIKYLAIALALLLVVGIVSGILGVVGLLGGLSGHTTGEQKTYSVSDTVRKLEMEIGAARLSITVGESLAVESDLNDLTVKEKNGRLIIRQTRAPLSLNGKAGELHLILPPDFVFDEADITTGAGQVTVEALAADTLSLELGAGEVIIDRLTAAKEIDIDGGAGALTVKDGALRDMELNMGVGELNLIAALDGNCELNCGVGEANVTLLGSREDYRIEVEKGIGSATVDGEAVKNGAVIGQGAATLDIECGVGAVTVKYR